MRSVRHFFKQVYRMLVLVILPLGVTYAQNAPVANSPYVNSAIEKENHAN